MLVGWSRKAGHAIVSVFADAAEERMGAVGHDKKAPRGADCSSAVRHNVTIRLPCSGAVPLVMHP